MASTPTTDDHSAEQIGWAEVADDLREALRKRIKYLDSADGFQAHQLVMALQAAYWLEVNARSFDEHLAKEIRGD